MFSAADFLNIGNKRDVQKVSLMFRTLSLLFTSPVSKMDKVELRKLRFDKLPLFIGHRGRK